jgi:hypothetical protein
VSKLYEPHEDEPSVYENTAWVNWAIQKYKSDHPERVSAMPDHETVVEIFSHAADELKQILDFEPRRKVGDPGVSAGRAPVLTTSTGHISMAWIIHFRGTQRTDLNYEQITQAGRELREQLGQL